MGERIERGKLKAAVFALADGTRTVAEIAIQIGTTKESVNGCIQRFGLQDRVLKDSGKERVRRMQVILARAIDAMSRTEPKGVSTDEWDAIVTEGTALLQRVAREAEARHG